VTDLEIVVSIESGSDVYATSYSCADLFTVSSSLPPFLAQSLPDEATTDRLNATLAQLAF